MPGAAIAGVIGARIGRIVQSVSVAIVARQALSAERVASFIGCAIRRADACSGVAGVVVRACDGVIARVRVRSMDTAESGVALIIGARLGIVAAQWRAGDAPCFRRA